MNSDGVQHKYFAPPQTASLLASPVRSGSDICKDFATNCLDCHDKAICREAKS